MTDLMQGATITIVGMGLVFLALGAILLLMKLLTWLFPPGETAAGSPQTDVTLVGNGDLHDEKIAAISAALALALDEAQVGHSQQESPLPIDAWVAAGRSRQLSHPMSRERRL